MPLYQPAVPYTGASQNVNLNTKQLTNVGEVEVVGNIKLTPNGSSNRTVNFGTGFGQIALSLYEGGPIGSGLNWGWGLQGGQMRFFGATGGGTNSFLFLSGGDFTSATIACTITTAGNLTAAGNARAVNVGISRAPSVRLDISGSAVSGSVGVEDTIRLARATTGGVSWPEVAIIALGRFATTGAFEPKTRLDFRLKNAADANETAEVTIMSLQSNGFVGIGNVLPAGHLHVTSTAAANIGGIIQGAASQSANLTEWRNSLATVLASISSVGSFLPRAGTATAGTAPIKFTSGTLLATPEAATLEFANDRFYLTNVATQKAIDRTSDVITATTTVSNTVTETTIYTATFAANALKVGNVIKVLSGGVISNATAADDVAINVYMGATLISTFTPAIGNVTNKTWEADLRFTVRSVGVSGSLTFFGIVDIDTSQQKTSSITTIDTTAAENVTVKVQWNNAKSGNTISIYQGLAEYKN